MRTSYFFRTPHGLAQADLSSVEPGVYWVARLIVPRPDQGKGHGRRLMKQMTEEADDEGAELHLVINPYGLLNFRDLFRWYERNGFVQQPDAERGYMVRKPRVKAESPPDWWQGAWEA